MQLLLVAVGGAAGSLLRFLAHRSLSGHLQPGSFPVGTFAVNVSGCLVFGVVAALLDRVAMAQYWRVALLSGLLGGYTTMSAFGWETLSLLRDRQYATAIMYALLTNVGCLAAMAAAYIGTSRLMRA